MNSQEAKDFVENLSPVELADLKAAVNDKLADIYRVQTKPVKIEADLHICIETNVPVDTPSLDDVVNSTLIYELAYISQDASNGNGIDFINVSVKDINEQEE